MAIDSALKIALILFPDLLAGPVTAWSSPSSSTKYVVFSKNRMIVEREEEGGGDVVVGLFHSIASVESYVNPILPQPSV